MTGTATITKPAESAPPPATTRGEVAVIVGNSRLPYAKGVEERFGIDRAGWRALTDAVFPSAKSADSIVLALSYCRARRLDVFKKVVHIVPIWDNEQRRMVETVWPGIAEHRITAFRTGQHAGADPATFGPSITREFTGDGKNGPIKATVTFPEWCQLTIYRVVQGQRVPFPGPVVRWTETYSSIGKTAVPNDRWQRAPFQMIEKCAEASALRRAFPEEFGDETTVEEAGIFRAPAGAVDADAAPPRPTREQFASKPLPHPGITDAEVEEPDEPPPAADAKQPPASPPVDAVAQGEAPDYRVAIELVGTGKSQVIHGERFQTALFAMLDENLFDSGLIFDANAAALDRLMKEDPGRRQTIGDRFMAISEGTYPAQGEAA